MTDFRKINKIIIMCFEVSDLSRYFTFKSWGRKAGKTDGDLHFQQHTAYVSENPSLLNEKEQCMWGS